MAAECCSSCERTSNTNGRLAIPALAGLLVFKAENYQQPALPFGARDPLPEAPGGPAPGRPPIWPTPRYATKATRTVECSDVMSEIDVTQTEH